MVKEGLVNLDFADVCSIISEMGTAMIGAGEASGERAELCELLKRRWLIRCSRTPRSRVLEERADLHHRRRCSGAVRVDEAASGVRQEVDDDANLIVGASVDPAPQRPRPGVVGATGIDQAVNFPIGEVCPSSACSRPGARLSIVGATASVQYARPESSTHPGASTSLIRTLKSNSQEVQSSHFQSRRRHGGRFGVCRFWRDLASPGRKHTMNHELRAGAGMGHRELRPQNGSRWRAHLHHGRLPLSGRVRTYSATLGGVCLATLPDGTICERTGAAGSDRRESAVDR